MIDLRNLTDYQRALQFPPSKVLGWMIRGAVYLSLGAFGSSVVFALAYGWSR